MFRKKTTRRYLKLLGTNKSFSKQGTIKKRKYIIHVGLVIILIIPTIIPVSTS